MTAKHASNLFKVSPLPMIRVSASHLSLPAPRKNLTQNHAKISTGVAGLDAILGGGLPPNEMYLLQGGPGTGKTTLGLQFLFNGAAQKMKTLFLSFSQTPG